MPEISLTVIKRLKVIYFLIDGVEFFFFIFSFNSILFYNFKSVSSRELEQVLSTSNDEQAVS